MKTCSQPSLPVPDSLRAREPGTFTRYSIIERLPDIGRRTLNENDFSPAAAARLEALIAEIPNAPLQPIRDPGAPDEAEWNAHLAQTRYPNWLDAPWFFAETYFFRRIIAATGYYQSGNQHDPFIGQKRQALAASRTQVAGLARSLSDWLADPSHPHPGLTRLLKAALWGNQADLSLWPAGDTEKPDHASPESAQEYLLVDQAGQAASDVLSNPGMHFDLIADNAGFELLCDLCLVDFILSHPALQSGSQPATVTIHLKAHPTYVSDATPQDARLHIDFLAGAEHQAVSELAGRLQHNLASGRLVLESDTFWTSPLPVWQMPPALCQRLSAAGLVVFKGDANYRRLLGDRHWSFIAPFEKIMSYFPAPLLALRTLKSEVVVGLTQEQIEEVSAQDEDWLTGGRWGLAQYTTPEQESG